MKQLIGHVSPETAYLVDDYPYGYTLRTSIRYWVETKKNFGQRFVSQTLNPKNGNWNKPKAGTYSDVVVLGVEDQEGDTFGHVQYAAVRVGYHDVEKLEAFAAKYQLDEDQAARINKAIKIKKEYAAKEIELTVDGVKPRYNDVLLAIIDDAANRLRRGEEI